MEGYKKEKHNYLLYFLFIIGGLVFVFYSATSINKTGGGENTAPLFLTEGNGVESVNSNLLPSKFSTSTTETTEEDTFSSCDLNRDRKCNKEDEYIFNSALDTCLGSKKYSINIDGDKSGCVDLIDKDFVFGLDRQVDTTTWNRYVNKKYGFELIYPHYYETGSWPEDIPISESSSIFFTNRLNPGSEILTVEVLQPNPKEKSTVYEMSDQDYLDVIKNSDLSIKKESILIDNKKISVYFFEGFNPNTWLDGRSTFVVLIPINNNVFVVIKRMWATSIDKEFQAILSSFRFR
jgi:hypothetical protein